MYSGVFLKATRPQIWSLHWKCCSQMDNCVRIIYDPGNFLVSYATMLRSQALYQENKKSSPFCQSPELIKLRPLVGHEKDTRSS